MISIAIDGPAGAGKSSVAKGLAKKLGYIYVDTGALYRTLAYHMLKNGVSPNQTETIVSLLPQANIEIEYVNDEQRVYLNGEDVSDKIRTAEVSMATSKISAIPQVRAHLLELQRSLARTHNVIMDGRDIGTVVLPDATLKIFLTVSPECRAQRRYKEMIEKGMEANLADVLKDIIERDYNDSHREVAPLKPAEDADIIENNWDSLDESINQLEIYVKGKLGRNE